MTHAPETCAINRLHFLAPGFGAGFSYQMRLKQNKIYGAENKRIKEILYSVQCYALHWTDNNKISIHDLCLLCAFVQCFLVTCTPLSGSQ